MKVMCIDADGLINFNHPSVKEGEVYEAYEPFVMDILVHPPFAKTYLLFEDDDNRYYFKRERFIPVSDIDETKYATVRRRPKRKSVSAIIKWLLVVIALISVESCSFHYAYSPCDKKDKQKIHHVKPEYRLGY
jgi:hypothetical protein